MKIETSMWESGKKILLQDLLLRLDLPKNLVWVVDDFDGITQPNSELPAGELMKALEEGRQVTLDDSQFSKFSKSLLDVHNIHVVGRAPNYKVDITAFDSDIWIVSE